MSAGFDACNLNPTQMNFLGQPEEKPGNIVSSNAQQPHPALQETPSSHSVAPKHSSPDMIRAQPDDRADGTPRIYQRVAEARKQQGFSLRTISRRTGIDIRTLRSHELPSTDLKLSELHAWQLALEIPMVDLIEDQSQPLSRPVKERATLVRIMKTAVAIKEAGGTPRIQRLADMLCEQLIELMPELTDISGWPQHGSRRPDNSSHILEQQVKVDSLKLD